MITNGLTPVFGSEPLSWGTFGVLFDPLGSVSLSCLCPLGDALETHACLLQNTSIDALWGVECKGRPGFFPFRGFRESGRWELREGELSQCNYGLMRASRLQELDITTSGESATFTGKTHVN